MLTPILMPALSPTMTEGNLVKWLKKEGDSVSSGDVIAEIETDKATMEVEAVDDGKIIRILVSEGTEAVKVNSPIAIILEEGEEIPSAKEIDDFISKLDVDALSSESKSTEQVSVNSMIDNSNDTSFTDVAVADSSVDSVSNSDSDSDSDSGLGSDDKRILATPVARRVAERNGIPLNLIRGSGPGGRITKSDVENFSFSSPSSVGNVALVSSGGGNVKNSGPSMGPSIRNAVLPEGGFESADGGFTPGYLKHDLSNVRKVIASRLSESKQTVPHFYLEIEVFVDRLMQLRADMNAGLEESGIRVSVNDFIVKACSLALQDVPQVNSAWFGDHVRNYINSDISIAVAVDDGLITPIVRKAESKSVIEISKEIKQLVKKAKSGELKPVEFQGGTFSVSNLGMFGISKFSAVVNPPQGAILAVGAVEKKLVMAKSGAVREEQVIHLTLSCDHRVIDGAVGAEFLNSIKSYIEAPVRMLI